MKKLAFYLSLILAILALFSSCGGSKNPVVEQETEEDENKVQIIYLEDFAKFDNHEQVSLYFGEVNVLATEMAGNEEDENYLVTIINPEQMHKVIIYWNPESGAHADFDHVEAYYSKFNPEWEFVSKLGYTFPCFDGVSVLDTITKLEEFNRGPIGFWGLGTDKSGIVVEQSDSIQEYTFKLDFSEEYYATADGTAAYNRLSSSRIYKSDEKSVKGLPLLVFSMSYKPKE
jgi:hypothetical protein